MKLVDLRKMVVAFDLDDTLYRESDYIDSGVRAVCEFIDVVYGKSIPQEFRTGGATSDPLGTICKKAGLPLSVKESLLWIYRLHQPCIKIDAATAGTLAMLRTRCREVVIITDGRSITQRLKLRALGLDGIRAYISDESGSEKPDPLRFKQIMEEFAATHYVYVGDNPVKDFIAPNLLGWKTIGLRNRAGAVHSQDCNDLSLEHLPNLWIDSLNELVDCLC